MPEYWFVIKPGEDQLLEALARVLADRPGFHLIEDRRRHDRGWSGSERRLAHVWQGDGMLVAEHPAEAAGGDSPEEPRLDSPNVACDLPGIKRKGS